MKWVIKEWVPSYLTPFKVKQYRTTLDEYQYTPDDEVVEGEIDSHRRYTEQDFNRNREILAREVKQIELFLAEMYHEDEVA